MPSHKPPNYSLIGVGVGPANLGLNALLQKFPNYDSLFLEKEAHFRWHPNMLFDFSSINVGFQKDLATLVDPTNYFTFLNYLVKNNKQYIFFNADFDRISRHEFEQYYQWAANSLDNIDYQKTVKNIQYLPTRDLFEVQTENETLLSQNVVVGTGIKAKKPACCQYELDNIHLLHSYQYLNQPRNFHQQNVLIVGGGQSAAEVLFSLLEDKTKLPQTIYWVSSKGYPVALDENPFANEIYTPFFSHFFYQLNSDTRYNMNKILKDTSDGINFHLLEKIYRRLFDLRYKYNHPIKLHFIPLSRLSDVNRQSASQYTATIRGVINEEINNVNTIVFCTGYNYYADDLLPNLKNYYGEEIQVLENFSIKPNNSSTQCKIFLNNGAKPSHGPADPNLSLMTWRNAMIINAIMNSPVYNNTKDFNMIDWGTAKNTNIELKNSTPKKALDLA